MPDHPSWPAELVEKGARSLDESFPRGGEFSVDAWPTVVRIVLSALSGDLVPREEHERAIEELLHGDPEKWSFRALVKVARLMLAANYPPDIFVGGGPATDSGVQFVVALRQALASVDADEALSSEVVPRSQADALAEALERIAGDSVPIEVEDTKSVQAFRYHKFKDIARSALASYRSKPLPAQLHHRFKPASGETE